MAQETSLLYPPGTRRLKCIITNYVSLTGSDKWTLQSIMLIVFRVILADVQAMVGCNHDGGIGGKTGLSLDVFGRCLPCGNLQCCYARAPRSRSCDVVSLRI